MENGVEKKRYFVELAYKGTKYHGWQIQPNAISVQEVLNDSFSKVLREEIEITGAGRTDSGVHASYFIAHFDSVKEDLEKDPKLVFKLNGILPFDIAIKKIFAVPEGAHARFDATSRTYHYFLHQHKDPFLTESSYYCTYHFDVDKMNEAAQILFEYTDFTSFSKLHTDVKTNNCKMMKAVWTREGTRLIFEVKADRFLRNMVRAIVGTLLKVGRGQISLEEFRKVIESKDRGVAGASVPGHALYLSGIEYPESYGLL